MSKLIAYIDKDDSRPVLLSEVIGALSYAIDLTEGQPPGHCLRCCWLGFHVGQKLSLNQDDLWDLYYTLLLKDVGCSSNAARLFELYGSDELKIKHDFKLANSQKILQVAYFVINHAGLGEQLVEKFQRIAKLAAKGDTVANELISTRCDRGAVIARQLGFNDAVANGIFYLDEHWNGRGQPTHISKDQVPLFSQIALLAQVVDVFHSTGGSNSAKSEVNSRSGTWFDPKVVEAFNAAAKEEHFWAALRKDNLAELVHTIEPESRAIYVDEQRLDTIALAFAQVVDSKSHFTFGHSTRVDKFADAIAEQLGFSEKHRRWLRRAALLHDIGKLGVSNSILDKPDKLTEEEWVRVRLHPKYTEEILERIPPFKTMAAVAGAHHERLDGKGYHKGLKGDEIWLESRILTVADIFDALAAKRPYRAAMSLDKALQTMEEMRGTTIDGDCLDALKARIPQVYALVES